MTHCPDPPACVLCCGRENQVELMAARDHGKPVVMCCGSSGPPDPATGARSFVNDLQAMRRLQFLVDVEAACFTEHLQLQRSNACCEIVLNRA